LVQSLFLEDCPIHTAAFAAGGSWVVAAGRRPFYYVADLNTGESCHNSWGCNSSREGVHMMCLCSCAPPGQVLKDTLCCSIAPSVSAAWCQKCLREVHCSTQVTRWPFVLVSSCRSAGACGHAPLRQPCALGHTQQQSLGQPEACGCTGRWQHSQAARWQQHQGRWSGSWQQGWCWHEEL
jgi:hypothetical protein